MRYFFLIVAFLFNAPIVRAAGLERVLLLHSFGTDYSPWDETATSFRDEFFKLSPEPIDLYEASVFTVRFEKPQEEGPLIEYLRALFSGHNLDLIVAMGGPAVSFAQRHRSSLFPDTPTLMTGVADQRVDKAALTTNDTAVGLSLDLKEYIRNILRLRPETENIFVIIGNSQLEQYWLSDLRREYQTFAKRVNFIWSNDLSFADILKKAASLPPQSSIFYFLLTIDAGGIPHIQGQALAALREVANAPIFGFGDYEMGHGIVGGPLNPTDALGRRAAGVGVRILKGEKPSDIKTPPMKFGAPVYDWRELKRWNISEALLPPDSIIRFRQPTLWEQYRWQIALVAGVLLAQTALIVYGFIQNRRRRMAEKSLAESEERMTFTAAAVNVGLWHYTRPTDQFWVTEYCRSIFKLRPGVPFSRDTLLRIVHPDEQKTVTAMLMEPSDGGPSAVREFRIVLPDGQIRWIRARTHSIGDYKKIPERISGLFIDLTDQKAAENDAAVQRLEVAHLMRVSVLGELSGAIAHELNQPLTAILSNAQAALQLLTHQAPDLEEVRDALGDIVHEDNRAGEVIKRIRGFLKKGQSKTETVDVNDLAESTISLLHSELIARQINLDVNLTYGLPTVVGDPIQLQQVILNILMNAMDAMVSTPVGQRHLAICTSLDKNGLVEVSIRDSGTGIKPADESRLFEPFYTTKDQGLGLGLALCSSIVEAHGGKVSLTNHNDGGAIAALSLPVEEFRVAAE